MRIRKHHMVTIYTTSGSKMSELAKEFFRNNGIEYTEHNVSNNKEAEDKLRILHGDVQTPVVDIDGRVIVGYQPNVYETILDQGK